MLRREKKGFTQKKPFDFTVPWYSPKSTNTMAVFGFRKKNPRDATETRRMKNASTPGLFVPAVMASPSTIMPKHAKPIIYPEKASKCFSRRGDLEDCDVLVGLIN